MGAMEGKELSTRLSLVEICELWGVTEAQRNYAVLILRGMGNEEAVKISQVQPSAEFGIVMKWLIENREIYAEEALEAFIRDLTVKAQEILSRLLSKGLERWDELDFHDRQHVMTAVEMIARGTKGREGGKKSYEKEVMEKHRRG